MTANVPSLPRSWLQVKGQRGGRPSPINRRHWKRGEEAQRHCPLAWEGPASCCQLPVDRQDGTRTRLGAPCQRHALRYGTPAIPMERVARGQRRWLGSCRHKLYVAVFFCTHPMFLPVGRGDTAAYLCRAPNGARHGLAQVPPHVLQRSDGLFSALRSCSQRSPACVMLYPGARAIVPSAGALCVETITRVKTKPSAGCSGFPTALVVP